MTLLNWKNVSGNRYELTVVAWTTGLLQRCDTAFTRYGNSHYADSGSIRVLDIKVSGAQQATVTVDALFGWTPTNGHQIEREVHCGCVCHREPQE